jgi:LemA protein
MGTSILVAVLLVIAAFLVATYNRLVTLRNRFRNAFAQIDVQLKRRYDLIPNLVETAKAYMAHERGTLEAVIEARNRASAAEVRAAADPTDGAAVRALGGAEAALTGVLTRFFALAEAYPELKANQNMMQLSEELRSTENRVAFARQAYNDAIMLYNTGRERFPANLVAAPLGFPEAPFLMIEEPQERDAPRVAF